MTFAKGDHFRVHESFEALVLTTFKAPFTGGGDKMIPVGLEFEVAASPPSSATAVSGYVQQPKQWETILVDGVDRQAANCSGYSIVVPFDEVERRCIKIN